MNMDGLQPNDALPKRIWGYLLERFPPVAYAVLVALFAGSAFSLSDSPLPASTAAAAATVVLLVFFHLRVMDEFKDAADDREAYPDRLLSRGVVSLPLLARMAGMAVAVQAVLAWSISPAAFAAWLGCVGFTVLMKVEFGVGRWLNQRLVLYAISHNPIVGLLGFFLLVVAGVDVDLPAVLFLAIVSLGSLAFEIGRKVRLPHEEVPGVASYSSVLGKAGADWALLGIRWVTALLIVALAQAIQPSAHAGWFALALAAGLTALLFRHSRGAKATEGATTLALLSDFVLIWSLAW
jgi:4-hydroxybenzoate polyprenyltransferase